LRNWKYDGFDDKSKWDKKNRWDRGGGFEDADRVLFLVEDSDRDLVQEGSTVES
jgi:hypothetical protein